MSTDTDAPEAWREYMREYQARYYKARQAQMTPEEREEKNRLRREAARRRRAQETPEERERRRENDRIRQRRCSARKRGRKNKNKTCITRGGSL